MKSTIQRSKKKSIIDYNKLPIDLKEQLKLMYSDGYHEELITYKDAQGQRISALRFETDTIIYMIRMSKELACEIMDDDDDFNDDYSLKSNKKIAYTDKHADNDYLVYSED
ncbi:hypothetical protein [Labilibacter marinus]|uniref:hypothetical protein n=1 Tax=Labilibacter marinus TaxID=1477105 RepID=UPI0009500258|nr:hypothetical protein [Labilibacter marinus]